MTQPLRPCRHQRSVSVSDTGLQKYDLLNRSSCDAATRSEPARTGDEASPSDRPPPAARRRHGRVRLRQVHRRRRARPAARRAVRRRRRLPPRGQHRQDDARASRSTTTTAIPGSRPSARWLAEHAASGGGGELLGAQAQVPRPAAHAAPRRSSSCTCTGAREVDRPPRRPAGPATSCPPSLLDLAVRDPRAARARRARRRHRRRPAHRRRSSDRTLDRRHDRSRAPRRRPPSRRTECPPCPLSLPLARQRPPQPSRPAGSLVSPRCVGIALIVVLITRFKLHPFLGADFGSLTVGASPGVTGRPTAIDSFTKGFGDTAAGRRHPDRAGRDVRQTARRLRRRRRDRRHHRRARVQPRTLPWAMALVGAIIGLPMFFEIGLVLLMPVIYLVARRSRLSLITVGIPALAGLSAMHGLVPPHPGPLVAIDALNADLGITLAPRRAGRDPDGHRRRPAVRAARRPLGRRPAPHRSTTARRRSRRRRPRVTARPPRPRPSFGRSRIAVTVLLPVVLMLGKALVDIFIADEANPVRSVLDFLGTPLIALLIAVIVGDVHPRPRRRHGPREPSPGRSSSRCPRSPASC